MQKKSPTLSRDSWPLRTEVKLLLGNCVGFEVPLASQFILSCWTLWLPLCVSRAGWSALIILHHSSIFRWCGRSPAQGAETRNNMRTPAIQALLQIPLGPGILSLFVPDSPLEVMGRTHKGPTSLQNRKRNQRGNFLYLQIFLMFLEHAHSSSGKGGEKEVLLRFIDLNNEKIKQFRDFSVQIVSVWHLAVTIYSINY